MNKFICVYRIGQTDRDYSNFFTIRWKCPEVIRFNTLEEINAWIKEHRLMEEQDPNANRHGYRTAYKFEVIYSGKEDIFLEGE